MNKYHKFISRRSTGKINAGIDYFSREISSIAIDDAIKININDNKPEELLEIYASRGNFNVTAKVPYNTILVHMHNLNMLAHFIYEGLKQTFIEYYKYKETREDEIDEHWEFLELWCM